eukprot:g1271.t1
MKQRTAVAKQDTTMSDIIIVSATDLQRMKSKFEYPEQSSTCKRRQELKSMSEKRATTWTNTIQALARQKEARDAEAANRELQEMLKVNLKGSTLTNIFKQADEEDKRIKAKLNDEAIYVATQQLLRESEEVRKYDSKTLQREVVEHWENQIQRKQKQKKLYKIQKDEFETQITKENEVCALLCFHRLFPDQEADEKELARLVNLASSSRQLRQGQLAQMEEIRERVRAERSRKMEEGEMQRKQQEEEEERTHIEKQNAQKMKINKQQELEQMKRSFDESKRKQIEQERIKEQKINEFNRNKENEELKLKTEAAETRRKRAEEAEKLVKLLEEQLKSSSAEQEARISKMCHAAVEQADLKSEEQEQEKQRAMANLKDNWKQQIERKQHLAELKKQQEFEDIKRLNLEDYRIQQEEQELREQNQKRNKEHQDYLVYQMQQKARKKKQEIAESLDSMKQIQNSQANHRTQVLQYAKSQQS